MSKKSYRLNASKAAVWAKCSQSVVLAAENSVSDILPQADLAEKGLRLHYAAAQILKNEKKREEVFAALKDDEERQAVVYYVDYINDLRKSYKRVKNKIEYVEEKFEYAHNNSVIVSIPDFAIIARDKVIIVDLKTGHMSVPADNLQNRIYAHVLAGGHGVKRAELRTVMPAIRQINFAEIEIEENYLNKIIDNFQSAIGKFYSGYHCRYCDAVSYCGEILRRVEKLKSPSYREQILRNSSELAEWYKYKKVIEKFYERLEVEILALFELGQKVDGLDVVETAGRRIWAEDVNSEIVARALGVALEDVTETKLLSPSQIEKRFKNIPQELSQFIIRPKSRAVIVREGAVEDKFE